MNDQHHLNKHLKHLNSQTAGNGSAASVSEPLLVHIIDDEESVRISCNFLISSLGLPTQVWSSALTVLEGKDEFFFFAGGGGVFFFALQAHLNQHDSPIALIALTGQGEIADAVNMLKLGAADYLEKPINSHRLQEALARAQALTFKRAELYSIKKLYAQLTEKEKQVAHELMQGNLNKNIADHLDISVRTVEVHRSQVMKKMQAQHVSELIQKLVMLDS